MVKKICFINTVGRAYDYFLKEQIEYLSQHGYEITFICSDIKEIKSKVKDGIKIVEIPMKRGVSLNGSIIAINHFYKHFRRNKYDMLVYSGPNASFYSSIAGKLSKIPIRIYSQWGIRYTGFNGVNRSIFKCLEKITCILSTTIQPDSKSNLKFSIKEGLYKENKSYVIGNGSAKGINFDIFDIDYKMTWRNEIRDKLKIKSDDIVIGFVGALRKEKGLNELLKAVKDTVNTVQNLKLVLVGDKDLYYTIDSKLRDWAENSEKVIFCGKTDEVYKYYASMDIFVFPSYREGFGMGPIEAGAMEVPTIASEIPGPIDSIKDGVTGILIQPRNSIELKIKILMLIEDPELRGIMGENARKSIINRFDQKLLMDKYLEDKSSYLSSY